MITSTLYKTGDVIEVACWAHTRRYFFKALKALTSEPELAKHALSLLKGLFRIERAIKAAPRKKREQVRREESQPAFARARGTRGQIVWLTRGVASERRAMRRTTTGGTPVRAPSRSTPADPANPPHRPR